VSAALEGAVHRALEKLPADRFSSAQGFATALTSSESRVLPRAAAPVRRMRNFAPWAVATVAVAVGAWAWFQRTTGVNTLPPSRLSIIVPGGTSFPGGARLLDIAADGSRIVYFTADATSSNAVLMMRELDAVDGAPIKGTENGLDLHITPDGRGLYFGDGSQARMLRLNFDGGTATPVQGAVSSPFVIFAPDRSVWYTTSNAQTFQITPDGKVTQRFTHDTLPVPMAVQQMLPGGKEALVKELQNNDGFLYVMNLETAKLRKILDFPIAEARYAAGYLVFVRNDGRLNAMPFDLKGRKSIGAPVQIAEDVSLSGSGIAQFAVADNGTIAYVPAQPRELMLVDRTGAAQALTSEKRIFHQPRFSPDGKSILVDFPSVDGRDVWKLDRSDGSLTRVTNAHDGHDANWSMDGKSLIYASAHDGEYAVYQTRPGSGTSERLYASNKLSWTGRWMPDGKTILGIAAETKPNSAGDIVRIEPGGKMTSIIATPATEGSTDISPDGKWLAYTSDLSGQPEVYVRSLASDADQVQVSQGGGTDPMWSHDGRELFYRATTAGHVMLTQLTMTTSPSLGVAARKPLFNIDDYDGAQPHSNYDVSPDGKGFVMIHRGPVGRIVIIQNLSALVRKLQGTAKAP
jgi:serine/threonine-protein kinase